MRHPISDPYKVALDIVGFIIFNNCNRANHTRQPGVASWYFINGSGISGTQNMPLKAGSFPARSREFASRHPPATNINTIAVEGDGIARIFQACRSWPLHDAHFIDGKNLYLVAGNTVICRLPDRLAENRIVFFFRDQRTKVRFGRFYHRFYHTKFWLP